MMGLVEQIRNSTQLRWNRVHKFKSKVKIYFEMGPYIVKTAETPRELIESFKLRHKIFHQEFRGIEKTGLDFDKFDYYFDHLIIVHKETHRIIGTYRLNCSSFSKESYTALEFDISLIWLHRGPFLELGRACIDQDHRKGSVISLLWRGIAEYMSESGSNILFGCSSLKVNNSREAALIYRYLLEQGAVTAEFLCKPTKKFMMKDFDAWYSYFGSGLSDRQREEAEKLIPSLLKSYLKQGAKVACEPAFDKEFDCIDLLTVLKREDLANSLAERFKIAK